MTPNAGRHMQARLAANPGALHGGPTYFFWPNLHGRAAFSTYPVSEHDGICDFVNLTGELLSAQD